MESQVDRMVKDVIKKADIATNDDVKALKREIQSLRKELKAAKASKAGKAAPAKARPAAKGKPKGKNAS